MSEGRALARVGGYEQIRWLTSGGMAEIFLARRPGMGTFEKECVVKRMRPEYRTRRQFFDMFLDEAELAASFRHQNLPQVFEFGLDDDELPFYAMEYLEGADCHQIVKLANAKGTRIPLEHVIQIVIGAAAGLHYAHFLAEANGEPLRVVHRDVSASNIFVTVSGGVKVVDFGVAQSEQRRTRTVDGTLKGKVAYMSPEQVEGERVDHRSDIFSLGVVLYELTVGVRPFDCEGAELEILKRVASAVYTPPSAKVATYPAGLERIVARALERDPEERFATADEMAEALERFAGEEGLQLSSRRLGSYVRELVAGPCAPLDRTAIRSTVPELDLSLAMADPTEEIGEQTEVASSPEARATDAPRGHGRRVALAFALGAGLVLALVGFGALPWFRPAARSPLPSSDEGAGEAAAAAPALEQADAAPPAGKSESADEARATRVGQPGAKRGSKRDGEKRRRPSRHKRDRKADRATGDGAKSETWQEDSPFPPVRETE